MRSKFLGLMFVAVFLIAVATAGGQEVEWTDQFGTDGFDFTWGIAMGDEALYLVGVLDAFSGSDVFVRKYDLEGNAVWTHVISNPGPSFDPAFGTGDFVFGSGPIAFIEDDVIVGGSVLDDLPGQVHAGGPDAFLRRIDPDGNAVWTVQFGTDGFDDIHDVAVDDEDIFVAGSTDRDLFGLPNAGGADDVFVQRYDEDGNLIWTRLFGTEGFDHPTGIAADDDDVYVVGVTDGALAAPSAGGPDAFIRKYDADGNEVWTRQFGTSGFDEAFGVAVDDDDVYLIGEVSDALPSQTFLGGGLDNYIRKYDEDGNEVWTRQFGTGGFDAVANLLLDDGDVFVTGVTDGTLPGQTSAGGFDAFVLQFDEDGNVVLTFQFGTSAGDNSFGGIAVDDDDWFVAGNTFGAFPGETNSGSLDIHVHKFVFGEDNDED